MFRKILVGLEGSDASWRALGHAIELAKQDRAEVWSLSVEELPRVPATIDEYQDEDEQQHAKFEEIEARAREMAEREGVHLETRTARGSAGDRLVEFARHGTFDLIVVGHRGHHSPFHRLAGSTAEHLVDHASCPVLVERGGEAVVPAPFVVGEGDPLN